MVANIRAITPANLADKSFDRCPVQVRLQDWATKQTPGSAVFRKFEIRRALAEEAAFFAPDELERAERAIVRVAYPILPDLYGFGGLDDLEEVVRRDARDLRDAIQTSDNYLAGQNAAFIDEIDAIDESHEHIWFLTLRVRLLYYEAQSL